MFKLFVLRQAQRDNQVDFRSDWRLVKKSYES